MILNQQMMILFCSTLSEKGFDSLLCPDKLPTVKDHQANFNARKGSVYGPYLEDANYVIIRF